MLFKFDVKAHNYIGDCSYTYCIMANSYEDAEAYIRRCLYRSGWELDHLTGRRVEVIDIRDK